MGAIGYSALILALVACVYSVFALAAGAGGRKLGLSSGGRTGLLLVFGLVSFATLVLLAALLNHDFSLEYVASYTSRDLAVPYLMSALWAGNSGSLLFWAWLLSLFGAVLVLRRDENARVLAPHASAVVMFVEAFFLIMLVFVQNPFRGLASVPADGTGLNPLLQNAAMIVHPPLLLAGYVAFTIPFALGIAALLSRRLDKTWAVAARGWGLLAWLLLGVGNLIGAWWAYVELGWGGYWAWDPVENAGLMPWLAGTAFLHSVLAQRTRGSFRGWSLFLVILTFLLTIFGTFLTRSDILRSVHTFGETGTGPLFLTLLFIIFFGSFGLLYARRNSLKSEAVMESALSRDGTFLLNNLFLVGATLLILLGTMLPALGEAAGGARASVSASFFNLVDVPIFLVIIVLATICVLTGWRTTRAVEVGRGLRWPSAFAVVIVIVLIFAGWRQWYALAAFAAATLLVGVTVSRGVRDVLARRGVTEAASSGTLTRSLWVNKDRYGAYLVHISIALMAIGITGSSVFEVEKEVALKPGESTTIKQYTITYEGLDFSGTEGKMLVRAKLAVSNAGAPAGRLSPEKALYRSSEQSVSEVAIRSTPAEDLYIILAAWDMSQAASFRILVNPLVMWIWVGGGVFLLGGLICFWPKMARVPAAPAAAPPAPASRKKRGRGARPFRKPAAGR